MDNHILAFYIYIFDHLDNHTIIIIGYFHTIPSLTFVGRRPANMNGHRRYRLREMHMLLYLIWG